MSVALVNGWTVHTLNTAAGDRAIYVSSSSGNDSNNGLTSGAPKRTLAAGFAALRNGTGDQLLLKRGDTWNEGRVYPNQSGRSANEPLYVGTWGSLSDGRAVWITGTEGAIKWIGNGQRFWIVKGLDISPGTDTRGDGGVGLTGYGGDILFEDCYIHNYPVNCGFLEGNDSDRINNVKFRRCVIADAWQAGGDGSRGQGFMLGHCNAFTVEECVVIGNGWQNGLQTRSKEAHNFYVYAVMDGFTIINSIVANGSFLGVSCNGNSQTVKGNIVVGNVVGIGARPQDALVEDNLVTECAFQGSGWDTQAIDARPLWTGSHTELNTPALIGFRNNLVVNNPGTNVQGNGAIQYNSSDPADSRASRLFVGNVVHGWDGSCLRVYASGGGYDPATLTDNYLVAKAGQAVIMFGPSAAPPFVFSGNHYYRADAGGAWFSGSASRTAAQWATFTGEAGATTSLPAFADPSRTLGTYAASIGLTGTTTALLAKCRAQREGAWDDQVGAPAIMAYMRAGFTIGSGTAPATPANLAATASDSSIAVSWSPSSGATSYTLQYTTTSGSGYTSRVVVGTSDTITGLVNGTTYYVRVFASNSNGSSSPTSEVSATPQSLVPGVPQQASMAGVIVGTGAGLSFSWEGVPGATSYVFQIGTASGVYTDYSSVGRTVLVSEETGLSSITIAGFAQATLYYARIRAVNAHGTGAATSEMSVTTPTTLPAAPQTPLGVSATSGDTQITVAWTASNGATSYAVRWGTTNGGPYPSTANPGANTSVVITGLVNGTPVYAQVAATNAGGTSAYSSQVTATPAAPVVPPATPVGLTATAGQNRVTLTWSPSSGASTYTVSWGTVSGGPYTVVTGIASPTYAITGLTNNVPIYAKVLAVGPGGSSAYSAEVTATPIIPPPPPPTPTAVALVSGNTQVVASWASSAGATSYTVSWGTSSGGPYPNTIAGITGTTTTITGLTNGTPVFVRVRAVGPGGSSADSAEVTATPAAPVPQAPVDVTVVGLDSSARVSWPAVPGATSYVVGRSTVSGGTRTEVTGITGLTTLLSGLTNGVRYFIVVQAVNATGRSTVSRELSVVPNIVPTSAEVKSWNRFLEYVGNLLRANL